MKIPPLRGRQPRSGGDSVYSVRLLIEAGVGEANADVVIEVLFGAVDLQIITPRHIDIQVDRRGRFADLRG